MINRFWRWLTVDEPDPKPVHVERFGDKDVDAAPGLALFAENVERRNLCQYIRDYIGIYADQREQLVERLFLRFALYVGDLQASELHHHSVPYGLLDHSLEVAQKIVKKLSASGYSVSPDYATNYREKPPWLYAALVASLFHDLGKVLDLEVETPDKTDHWNPYVEPLAAFCRRNRLTKTGRDFWSYRKGRGYNSHAWHGSMLFPLVLPPQATAYLGQRLALVSDAMVAETLDRAPEPIHEFASLIAKAVHEADIESSKADRAAENVNRESAPVPAPRTTSVYALQEHSVVALVDQAFAKLQTSDFALVPGDTPVTSPPPAARRRRPPLDLGVVLGDFTRALRVAVEKGWIPLNQQGGLYIGRKYVYLQFMEGLEKVMELMVQQGSDIEDRYREAWTVDLEVECPERDLDPQSYVFHALLAQKRLPGATEERNWVQQGRVFHPGASGPWWGQLVVMSSMPFQDLPVFQGWMELDQWGDPEKEEKKSSVPLPPEEPALQARPSDEAYGLRVDAELEPARLLATLTDALRAGVFHRPGGWSPIYIRPDFTWVLVPEAFRILLPRLGIVCSEDLENRILTSISRMAGLSPGEDGKVLLRIKVHPESRQAAWAFALDTRRILPPETISSLGIWPHPIRVIQDGVPGEYAAPAGPMMSVPCHAGVQKEEFMLETRRLRSFSDFTAKVWDLYARQAEVRKLLVDLNEEFTQKVPKSRLVLYLKRKDSSFEYSALHWGFTIPGLKASPMGKGGRRVRRIKHISTPLNDSIIHCGGGDSRRKLFYDFDRRRLAANAAYRKVTKAITTIRQTLKGRGGKVAGTELEAPLPMGEALTGMNGEALETVQLGWRLLSRMLGKEAELLRLTREYGVTPADSRIRLLFSLSVPDGEVASARWNLPPEEASFEKLTYAKIRELRIPEAHQKLLSRYERSRRGITQALLKADETFKRLSQLPALALRLADLGLADARRTEVDAFGRPHAAQGIVG
jgi:hypothetical protein